MLKIEIIDFHPLPEDKDLIVKLLPLSQTKKSSIGENLSLMDENAPRPEVDRANKEAMYKMMETAIVSVSGFEVGDTKVDTAELFMEYAPEEVFWPVYKKVVEICKLNDEDEKK